MGMHGGLHVPDALCSIHVAEHMGLRVVRHTQFTECTLLAQAQSADVTALPEPLQGLFKRTDM